MQTQRELDEMEAREADVAARLFLRAGTDEGPPTCPPPTPEEAAAEDEKYGLLPIAFDFESQREFIRRSMEAVRLREHNQTRPLILVERAQAGHSAPAAGQLYRPPYQLRHVNFSFNFSPISL